MHRARRRAFTTHICDVEVDRETGHVKILRYTAIQDVGRAIHPSYVEGQMQGGVAQGVGWALSEEYIYDKDGRLENPGFLDYRVPVASDMPMIDTVLIEVPNPRHPFGARGCGEVPIIPPDGGGGERDCRRDRDPAARSADVAAAAAGRHRPRGADARRGRIEFNSVVPAKAGTQNGTDACPGPPAFAGVTVLETE